jgi:hypothetical protein
MDNTTKGKWEIVIDNDYFYDIMVEKHKHIASTNKNDYPENAEANAQLIVTMQNQVCEVAERFNCEPQKVAETISRAFKNLADIYNIAMEGDEFTDTDRQIIAAKTYIILESLKEGK